MQRSSHGIMIVFVGLTISAIVLASPGCGKPQPRHTPAPSAAKPRLLEWGAKKCIPCKMMAPIIEDLKQNYTTAFETVFIDVWENHQAGKAYGIKTIPTQIFFDSQGKELYRHEGFFSKEDILKKWAEFGLSASSPQ